MDDQILVRLAKSVEYARTYWPLTYLGALLGVA